MAEYINKEAAYDYATLDSWYIASVTNGTPVWTEEHLEELLNDFYVIPKDTPSADVVEVVRCKDCAIWKNKEDGLIKCPYCFELKEDNDFCSYGERRTE